MPNAHSWTGEVVDAKSNKMYRVYSVGPYMVTQYGAQGNGRTGGTISFSFETTDALAEHAARRARQKKSAYDTVHELDFDVDISKLTAALGKGGDKAAGEFLDNLHTAAAAAQGKDVNVGLASAKQRQRAERSGTVAPQSTSTTSTVTAPAGGDRLDAFAEKALAALTLSTTNVAAAAKAYGELSEELEDLQEEFRKATSFLGTVELMITDALTK